MHAVRPTWKPRVSLINGLVPERGCFVRVVKCCLLKGRHALAETETLASVQVARLPSLRVLRYITSETVFGSPFPVLSVLARIALPVFADVGEENQGQDG